MVLIPFRKSFRVLCPKEEPAEPLNALHAAPLCERKLLEAVFALDRRKYGRGPCLPAFYMRLSENPNSQAMR